MQYGCGGSGAYASKISPYLNFLGFSSQYAHASVDANRMYQNMNDFIGQACPHITAASDNNGGRHAWVWDGIKGLCTGDIFNKSVNQSFDIEEQTLVQLDAVHCNWAWGPNSGNGWYAIGDWYGNDPEQVYVSGYSQLSKLKENYTIDSVLEYMKSYQPY